MYEGSYKDNEKDGFLKFLLFGDRLNFGDKYFGMFKSGKRNGYGEFDFIQKEISIYEREKGL